MFLLYTMSYFIYFTQKRNKALWNEAANCISFHSKILCYHFFSGFLSFFFVVVVGMGPTDFQQSWVFIISSEGRFTSEKSLSLFQHQTMSGSELPTSTFFPGSFFALLHSPISKLPALLTWDVVKPPGNNLPFASFMRSWRNHCRGREVSELKLFFLCAVSLFQLH